MSSGLNFQLAPSRYPWIFCRSRISLSVSGVTPSILAASSRSMNLRAIEASPCAGLPGGKSAAVRTRVPKPGDGVAVRPVRA